jgi:hypothetical protein
MIQSPDIEILMPQTDRRVSLEIASEPPINEATEEISELTKSKEQSIAEVGGYSG